MGSNSETRSPILECMPERGLENDFLLDVIFSFTALHIAAFRPHDAERYIAVAVRYRDRGIARIAPYVAEPSEEVVVPMFWFSVLIGMVTIAMTVVTRDRSPNAFILTLVKLAQLWRGAEAIAQRAETMGGGEEIIVALRVRSERGGLQRTSEVAVKLEPNIENHIAELERHVRGASQMYADSAAYTRRGFKSWVAKKTIDEVLSWSAELGNEFAASLSAGNPLALLCTLVHGVLMHQVDDRWWAAGSGKAVVHECSTALADCNPEWRPLIRWARERVGLSLPLIP